MKTDLRRSQNDAPESSPWTEVAAGPKARETEWLGADHPAPG